MQTGYFNAQAVVAGLTFNISAPREAEGQVSHVVVLEPGIAGAISAAGVDGLVEGHGIQQGDKIDVHWSDPSSGDHKCRRGLVVDTAETTSIEFDESPAGEGDALPDEDTAVVVDVQTEVATSWDGDDLELLVCGATGRMMADFRTAVESKNAAKLASGVLSWWLSDISMTNPYTGDPITVIRLSNGSVAAVTFNCGLLYQSVS